MQIPNAQIEGIVIDAIFDNIVKNFGLVNGDIENKDDAREYVKSTLKGNGMLQGDLANMNGTIRQLIHEYMKIQDDKKLEEEAKGNYVTVGQMKALIANLDDSLPFIIQKDAEGNDFSPLSRVDVDMDNVYVPITTWYGERYIKELTSEDIEKGFSESDLANPKDNPIDAVFLVPIN